MVLKKNLDVQYTIGIAEGVPTFFISVGEDFHDGDLEGFLDIINFLSGENAPPQVLTTSYGQNEYTISRKLASYASNSVEIPHLTNNPVVQYFMQFLCGSRRARCHHPLLIRRRRCGRFTRQ